MGITLYIERSGGCLNGWYYGEETMRSPRYQDENDIIRWAIRHSGYGLKQIKIVRC